MGFRFVMCFDILFGEPSVILRVEKPKVSNLGFNSFVITRTEVRIYLKCLDFARYKSAV